MDIARTPATPDGNTHMADAPPAQPHDPAVIRREDYVPYPWRVPEVALDFRLGASKTRVRSTLAVEPNPQGNPSNELRLNGDGLTPIEVTVDGEAINSWEMVGDDLVVPLAGERHEVSIVTELDPAANSQLMGLYASSGMLCTQCEAEGFRRITFFPDRPDVLSTYKVRMEGSKEEFPVLLSNGNCTARDWT